MLQPTFPRAVLSTAVAIAVVGAGASAWPVRELRDEQAGQMEGVAFSRDGSLLATADNSGMIVVRAVPCFAVAARLQGRWP